MDTTASSAALDDPFDLGDDDLDAAATDDPATAPTAAPPAPVVVGSEVPEPPPVTDVDRQTEQVERAAHSSAPRPTTSDRLAPAQRRTFDELLAVGAERPMAPVGLVEELRTRIAAGTGPAMARWGQSLWFSKSMLTEAARCEGMIAANAAVDPGAAAARPLHPATMVGIVAHRAIQICQTHPGESPAHYIAESVRASRNEDRFGATWETMGDAERSDLQMAATSRLISFLDSWPPLRDEWAWRFEESTQSRIGKLTLAARTDLVLGRPRPDGRQTMLLCDLKTGSLGDHHDLEGSYYALVAALRWGVPPWRSMVYSLASGDWSEPDVTPQRLSDAADAVIAAVRSRVAVLCEERDAVLTAGEWCRFCPAAATCPANAAPPVEAPPVDVQP